MSNVETKIHIIAFTLFLFTMLVLIKTDLLSDFLPKKINTQVYEVQSMEFKGEKTFLRDGRSVSFDTSEGVFVYPHNAITFQGWDEELLRVTITDYGIRNKHIDSQVTVHIPQDQVVNIQNDYATKYSENIKVVEKK